MSKIYSYLRRAWLFLLVTLFAFPGTVYGNPPGNSSISVNGDFRALNRPLNILVIGEHGVGKSKLASSILRNTKNVSSPNVAAQMSQEGIKHNRIIAAENNHDVRVIELDVDEFLQLDPNSNDAEYLMLNISWVLYVVNETNCRLDRMLSVYDRINRCYCKKYNVAYKNYSIYQDKQWFIDLKAAMGINDQLFYGFALIANMKNENLDKQVEEHCKEMANGRKIFYVNYSNDNFIPTIPSTLIETLEGHLEASIAHKDYWSHSVYLRSNLSQLWRKVVDFFCCCLCCDDNNIWSYHYDTPEFVKNHQGTRTNCIIF